MAASTRPWKITENQNGLVVITSDPSGVPWVAQNIRLEDSKGRIVAEVVMWTSPVEDCGIPRVNSLTELKANADLICKAVNSYVSENDR